jgi:hypothetical protein
MKNNYRQIAQITQKMEEGSVWEVTRNKQKALLSNICIICVICEVCG